MKALATHKIEKQPWWHWPQGRSAVLQRLAHWILRDLIPTLAMVGLVSWGALIVTEHIYLAKISRSVALAEATISQGLIQKEAYIPGISLPLNKP